MFSSFLQNLKFREAAEETTDTTTGNEKAAQPEGGTVRRQVMRVDSARRAQKVSAVYAAVRILSDAVASLPLQYQRWSERQKRYVNQDETQSGRLSVDSRRYYLLTIRPNDRLTSFQFFKNLVTQILLHGNAYAMFHGEGEEEKLYLLPPTTNYDKYRNEYNVTDAENPELNGTYPADKILHFKNTSLDGGYTGVSTVHFAATQLNIAATAANETLDRFATGGRGKFLYHNNDDNDGGTFSQGEYNDDELLNNGNDIQSQLNEGRDVIVMRGDGKLEPMSMTAADLQYLSSEEFNIREICRFFGIPLQKMFEKGDQTYKSVDAANIALYSEGLRPILNAIENEFNAKEIPWQFATTYRYRFDTSPLYLTDKITQADYLIKRIQSGTMTVNEARAEMNLSPVEDGDKIVISTNLAALTSDKIGGNSENNNNNNNNNQNNSNNGNGEQQ